MEQPGIPELGAEIDPRLIESQGKLRAFTMRSDKLLLPKDITPDFDVTLDLSNHSLVIFKP